MSSTPRALGANSGSLRAGGAPTRRPLSQVSRPHHREELGQYFLHIKNVKKYSRAASTIAICGIKFFYEKTLNREFTTLKLVQAQREKKLPVILSVEEVLTIPGRVRLPRYRVCLGTIYSCGLRLQEGTHIQVRDIDSGRGMLHVRHGKGGKDRYVPLPERTVELLREYWVTHRNPGWMFPSEGKDHIALKASTEPMHKSSVQDAFRAALKETKLNKAASVHTLRHSWATHLLEAGVNLRLIQEYLGSQLSADHQHLHTSDAESGRPRSGSHQPDHERAVIW